LEWRIKISRDIVAVVGAYTSLPVHFLIFVELGFLLLATLVAAAVIVRVLSLARDKAQGLAEDRERARRALKRELEQAQATIGELQAAAAAANADEVDFESLVIELTGELQGGAENLSELGEIQAGFTDAMDRMGKLHESEEAWDREGLQKELELLREQSARSGKVINTLTAALEGTRSKLKAAQQSTPRRRGSGPADDTLEKNVRRLSLDNKALQQKLQSEMDKNQEMIDRIASKLRVSEESKRTIINEANQQRKTMSVVIDELQQQLRDAVADPKDSEEVRNLKVKLKDTTEALERALRERDFLDSRFVAMEEALDDSEAAAEELERAKTEYRMLEERYLELENKLDQDVAAPDIQPMLKTDTLDRLNRSRPL